jgi:hypothetical protein
MRTLKYLALGKQLVSGVTWAVMKLFAADSLPWTTGMAFPKPWPDEPEQLTPATTFSRARDVAHRLHG